MSIKPIDILLVEDNPADARLIQRKMQAAKIINNLHVVHNGRDAIAFVNQEGAFIGKPRPDLILLDLNLPGIDGREVLSRLKSGSHTRMIPIVILTSSEADEDILRSYELRCNAYIRKPLDLEGYRMIVAAIDHFWLGLVHYPPRE